MKYHELPHLVHSVFAKNPCLGDELNIAKWNPSPCILHDMQSFFSHILSVHQVKWSHVFLTFFKANKQMAEYRQVAKHNNMSRVNTRLKAEDKLSVLLYPELSQSYFHLITGLSFFLRRTVGLISINYLHTGKPWAFLEKGKLARLITPASQYDLRGFFFSQGSVN